MDEHSDHELSLKAEGKKERKPQTKKAAFELENWFLDEMLERTDEERLRLVEQFSEQNDPSPARQETRKENRFSEKTIPSWEHFNEIVQISFWASLRKEEGKFTSFTVAYEEKANDPWTVVFEEPKPFNVEQLAKLAPAIGNLKAAAKVYPNANGALEIWGVSNYYDSPLKVKVLEPGRIVVSYFIKNISVISGEESFLIITKRQKKSYTGQNMVMLLGTLAHNVVTWARRWLLANAPKLKSYGVQRMVRDMLAVSGFIEWGKSDAIRRVVLNRTSALTRACIKALRALLKAAHVSIMLDET